jgi:hypothetical protein
MLNLLNLSMILRNGGLKNIYGGPVQSLIWNCMSPLAEDAAESGVNTDLLVQLE